MSDDEVTRRYSEPDFSSEDPLKLIGSQLANKYKIAGYIGSGGFSDVYHGYNLNLAQHRVVIKVIKREEYAAKFEKEARILSELDHPNICRIVDFLPKDRAIIVPYIDGKNCEEILESDGPLTEHQFFEVAHTVLSAISAAHSIKIAHRDIKPSNIMIDKYGHVYLIDFGIAKRIGGTLTKTGYRAMTPQFAAPERHQNRRGYNPFLSDIYEIGITLYYLLTRQTIYRSPIQPNLDQWGGPESKQLAPQLVRVLKRASHPDPKYRFQTVQEFQQAFNRIKSIRRSLVPRYVVTPILLLCLAGTIYLAREELQGIWDGSSSAGSTSTQEARSVPITPSGELGAAASNETLVPTEPPADLYTDLVRWGDSGVISDGSASQISASVDDHGGDIAPTQETDVPAPPDRVAEYNLSIQVRPGEEADVFLDKALYAQGTTVTVDTGLHTVSVLQPHYPLVNDAFRIGTDTVITYNLLERFQGHETMTLRIGAVPRRIGGHLTVTLNGLTNRYDRVPVPPIKRTVGRWVVGFGIEKDNRASAAVDSFVVRTIPGEAGLTVRSPRSQVDFGRLVWDAQRVATVTVYWTEK